MFACAKVIIFLGPPGSGKGTQAAHLSSVLGIPAISTGEILRRECQSGSALGKAVHQVLASGRLVDDNLINRVIAHRLRQPDCQAGCILDGYPRTVAQARYLDKLLARLRMPAPVIFDFDICAEDVVSRLSRRRQCTQCGRIFSLDGDSNGTGSFCDHDGSRLIHRSDDHPATVRERLRVYATNAAELIAYYRPRDYHRICATGAPQEVAAELLSVLASGWSAPGVRAVPSLPARTAFSGTV